MGEAAVGSSTPRLVGWNMSRTERSSERTAASSLAVGRAEEMGAREVAVDANSGATVGGEGTRLC